MSNDQYCMNAIISDDFFGDFTDCFTPPTTPTVDNKPSTPTLDEREKMVEKREKVVEVKEMGLDRKSRDLTKREALLKENEKRAYWERMEDIKIRVDAKKEKERLLSSVEIDKEMLKKKEGELELERKNLKKKIEEYEAKCEFLALEKEKTKKIQSELEEKIDSMGSVSIVGEIVNAIREEGALTRLEAKKNLLGGLEGVSASLESVREDMGSLGKLVEETHDLRVEMGEVIMNQLRGEFKESLKEIRDQCRNLEGGKRKRKNKKKGRGANQRRRRKNKKDINNDNNK